MHIVEYVPPPFDPKLEEEVAVVMIEEPNSPQANHGGSFSN